MRTLILILIVVFCNVNTSNSQSGWFHQNSNCNNELLSVSFLNANTGICVGGNGKILRTTDGGNFWDSLNSPTQHPLLSVYIIDSNTIITCGYSRTILKTTNFGNSWYRITNIADGYNLEHVQFVNYHTGFIASEIGVILKTTNTGESWFELDHPYPYPLVFSFNSLFFFNENTGYVVGQGDILRSQIIKTTNGGLNWIRQESFATSSLNCVKFVNRDTGLIGGSSGILRTTNGGVNWIYNGAVYSLNDISFLSNEIAYMTGGNGKIIKSTNGGLNWFNLVSNTTEHLAGIYFLNELTGYAVGANGTILKTTTGGIVGINISSNEIPESFSLKQNYPNPFNPVTHIEFNISQNNSFVKLKVFDINGREFGYLVNQKLDAGIYTLDFDGSHLASGTYFYRIEVSSDNLNYSSDINFTETKSMVLLK